MIRWRLLLAISLVMINIYPQSMQSAFAAAPSTGTAVSWTNDTYFDGFTSQSGATTSDLSPTNSMVWQVFYSNTTLTIPADAVNRVGFNTYISGSNSWTYYISISSVDDTLGSFPTESIFATGSTSYSAGGFNQNAITTAVNIPAHRYFLIGISGGAYYRTYKALAANRSAQIGGLTYVTQLNTLYYGPHGSGPTTGIPTAVGGSTTGYTTYSGYGAMLSVKFKATGVPTGPALTTPDTPTVTSIAATSAVFSEASTVANAQSYIASLYASNGLTLLETRTVTNSQVTAGYSWTGLAADTTYQVGMTAVGDGTNYGNSGRSPLRTFTTTKIQTSLSLSFSSQSATFNTPILITATISGSTSGKITFFSNGKRIPKCISKSVTSSSSSCNWKPATRGSATVSAAFTPTSTSELSSIFSASIRILHRSSAR